jgi:hypothetical protein
MHKHVIYGPLFQYSQITCFAVIYSSAPSLKRCHSDFKPEVLDYRYPLAAATSGRSTDPLGGMNPVLLSQPGNGPDISRTQTSSPGWTGIILVRIWTIFGYNQLPCDWWLMRMMRICIGRIFRYSRLSSLRLNLGCISLWAVIMWHKLRKLRCGSCERPALLQNLFMWLEVLFEIVKK